MRPSHFILDEKLGASEFNYKTRSELYLWSRVFLSAKSDLMSSPFMRIRFRDQVHSPAENKSSALTSRWRARDKIAFVAEIRSWDLLPSLQVKGRDEKLVTRLSTKVSNFGGINSKASWEINSKASWESSYPFLMLISSSQLSLALSLHGEDGGVMVRARRYRERCWAVSFAGERRCHHSESFVWMVRLLQEKPCPRRNTT